ncbi:Protein of unknown function (DUF1286) [Metallosphaera yellowstonensis MK1]|jgi:Protein of unknown function (DUF1286).|uniref:Membrane-bound metal-dependent hydrolase (DUF457) n=1 Tax=Metallosphaera yellowstonensis MK1 TaxID=671065 RepID=H2C7Q7_9CREN|nr:DUF1286 domain-containing protein [Metallosphaera yellowstonensis]EHP68183.1 Protein of unknown function (DUF1286) [Metallosphaera yellowstonensis MK1]
MKLLTHYIFTTGFLTLLSTPYLGFYVSLLLSSVISSLSNTLIDRLGHEVRGGFVRRTPTTHTLPRSVIWGLLPSLPLFYFFHVLPILLLGVLSGPSHMLLDIFTERGIYVKRGGRWRRFALAHFSYDNPVINGTAILAGALLLYLALSFSNHQADFTWPSKFP